MNHLTDHDIQYYLDHIKNPEIEEHLATCAACRGQIELYKHIFAGLKEEENIALPSNFSNLVIGRIEGLHEKRSRWMEWLFTGLAAFCGVAITAYYSTAAITVEAVQSWFPEIEWRVLAETFGDRLGSMIGNNFHFLIFGLFILLLIEWMDKKLIRPRLHR
ncbi:hypothetical protein HUU42_15470 [bacterium]|nr:hypothetical protein [bacterium]